MKAMRRRLIVAIIGPALIAGGVAGWYFWLRKPPLDDRRQIIQLVADVERGVEQKRTSTVMGHISSDYSDSHGFKRRLVQRLVIEAFRQPSPIDVVVQLEGIQIEGDRASLHVEADYSLEGPIGEGQTTHVSADVELRRERGGWKVIKAEGWQSPALQM